MGTESLRASGTSPVHLRAGTSRHIMEDILDEIDIKMGEMQAVINITPQIVENLLHAVEIIENDRQQIARYEKEIQNCNDELMDKDFAVRDLEQRIMQARKTLDDEKMKNKKLRRQLDSCIEKIQMMRRVLIDDQNQLPENIITRLSIILSSYDHDHDELEKGEDSAVEKVETTGSIITDLSYTRDDEDLLEEPPRHRKNFPLLENQETKKDERKVSTSKSIEVKNGEHITASNVTTELITPSTARMLSIVNTNTPHFTPRSLFDYSERDPNTAFLLEQSHATDPNLKYLYFSTKHRTHNFFQKMMMRNETCKVCFKKINFGSFDYKCKDCKGEFHALCRYEAPLPCVPLCVTPARCNKAGGGCISDFTPLTSPMVPPLVIYCIKEIEARGRVNVELYKIPGDRREIKSLKEMLLNLKGIPNFSDISDVHTFIGVLIDFLRSLRDPLTTAVRWSELVQAANSENRLSGQQRLKEIITDLPKPNRDTLSYLILHLKKVSITAGDLTDPNDLSYVFGEIVVGLSRLHPSTPSDDINKANKVMSELIQIPAEYYVSILNDVENDPVRTPLSKLKYFASPPSTVKKTKNPFPEN